MIPKCSNWTLAEMSKSKYSKIPSEDREIRSNKMRMNKKYCSIEKGRVFLICILILKVINNRKVSFETNFVKA